MPNDRAELVLHQEAADESDLPKWRLEVFFRCDADDMFRVVVAAKTAINTELEKEN